MDTVSILALRCVFELMLTRNTPVKESTIKIIDKDLIENSGRGIVEESTKTSCSGSGSS